MHDKFWPKYPDGLGFDRLDVDFEKRHKEHGNLLGMDLRPEGLSAKEADALERARENHMQGKNVVQADFQILELRVISQVLCMTIDRIGKIAERSRKGEIPAQEALDVIHEAVRSEYTTGVMKDLTYGRT